MCGKWDPSNDGYTCPFPCKSEVQSSKPDPQDSHAVLLLQALKNNNPSEQLDLCEKVTSPTCLKTSKLQQLRCKSCGGTDHVRKSSKKCKFYKSPVRKIVAQNCNVRNEVKSDMECLDTSVVDKLNLSNNQQLTSFNHSTSSDLPPEDISSPSFIYVGESVTGESETEALKRYSPVVDVESTSFTPTKTVFKVFEKNRHNRKVEIVPTADVLTRKYWNYSIVSRISINSNKYIEDRKKSFPDLDCWKRKKDCRPITVGCVYQFIAIIYYMGIVKLPDKDDYWSNDKWMPEHPVCNEFNMTRNRFRFIWRHIHVNHTNDDLEDDVVDDDGNQTEVEVSMDRVDREQDDELSTDTVSNDGDDDSDDDCVAKKDVWFSKIAPLIDHFRNVSEDLTYFLGSNLSLDEMIIRFGGRSNETHRIKNKPIGEGYKFFVLSTVNGFVVNFTPDGRSAAKNDWQEYSVSNKLSGKTESMILHLLSIIDKFKRKQKKRNKKRFNSKKKVTRCGTKLGSAELFSQEDLQDEFIVAMDNYFTLPQVISSLRAKGIGVVGTSRFRRNWPPQKMKEIDGEMAKFNDFYWMIDDDGTLLARWKDNGMVFCVSTVHRIGNKVKRLRKKPRVTNKNKHHVSVIWGEKGVVEVFIPILIDNYNHWMGGVDLTDQRVAYYHPDMRCYRNWIPMLLQIVSMIRNNCFLIYHEHYGVKGVSHKKFTMEMIDCLMSESSYFYENEDRNNPKKQVDKVPPSSPQVSVTSRLSLQLNSPDISHQSSVSSLSNSSLSSFSTSLTSRKSKRKASSTLNWTSTSKGTQIPTIPEAAIIFPPPSKKRKVKNLETLEDYPERLKGLKKDHVRIKSNLKGIDGKVKRQAKLLPCLSFIKYYFMHEIKELKKENHYIYFP